MEHTFEPLLDQESHLGWDSSVDDWAEPEWHVPLDDPGPDRWNPHSSPLGPRQFDEEDLSVSVSRIAQKPAGEVDHAAEVDHAVEADRGPATGRGFAAGFEAGLEAGLAAALHAGRGAEATGAAVAETGPRPAAENAAADAAPADVAGDAVSAGIWRTVALRGRMGAFQAQELREFAALSALVRSGRFPEYGKDTSIAYRSLVADLALAHRVSDRTMAVRVDDAERFVNDYPASVAALAAGRVELGHLKVIADHGLPIHDPAARAAYEQVVLAKAAEVTPGRLGRYAQLQAARLGEVSFQDRYEHAHTQRRVWMVEVGDGMSQLGVLLPTVLAEGIWDRLTQQAKAITTAARTATRTAAAASLDADPGTAGQGTGEPGTAGQGTAGQGTAGQGTAGQGTGEPGTGEPGSSASGAAGAGAAGAAISDSGTSDSGTSGSGVFGSNTSGSGTLDSGSSDPGTFDARTFDQLRTDLLTELLLTGQPTGCENAPHAAGIGIRAEVAVVIPMLTLLSEDDDHPGTGPGTRTGTGTGSDNEVSRGAGNGTEPATIAGKSPIDPATARRLAADAPRMVRLLTDPVTGIALTADTYTPSAKLRRFLRLRDGRCRQPGCTRPAGRCDLDHTIAWEIGGPTTPKNLAHLCRNHHTLKHYGGWNLKQVTPGVLEWTSPTGRIVTDRPDPRPVFTES